MDAKTLKSELTRTAIVDAAMQLAAEQGLDAITLQAVADRVGLSKSGVFSRVGSREALQKAVIEAYGRAFFAEVFLPAMELPRGLPRLDTVARRWIERMRDETNTSCIFFAGAFEFDDRDGPLRDFLQEQVVAWRGTLRRSVLQAVEAGHLKPDTDPQQLAGELSALAMGVLHDTRFLRDADASARALASWQRLLSTYRA